MAEGRFSGKLRRILELVTDRRFYKPMILLLVLVVAIEWSSFPILGFYLVTIFKVLFTSSLANRAQTVAVKIPDASWCIKHLLNSSNSILDKCNIFIGNVGSHLLGCEQKKPDWLKTFYGSGTFIFSNLGENVECFLKLIFFKGRFIRKKREILTLFTHVKVHSRAKDRLIFHRNVYLSICPYDV